MLPIIVTVIEAGPLEYQVCLLVESLRNWGGRLAGARVIAVKPRFGPRVSAATRSALEHLDVEYEEVGRTDKFQWFAWLNKPAAVRHVATGRSGSILWLDADILILGEPAELLFDMRDLSPLQFAACASDKNIGTASDDDEFAPYFRMVCQTLGVDFTSLPLVMTEEEQIPVRAYWNSGVYAFDAGSGLAELHHNFTMRLIEGGIASRKAKLFFSDQVSLGMAVHHLGLRRKDLPRAYNFAVQPHDVEARLSVNGKDIRILHYHGCLWPPSFERLCLGLRVHHGEIADWLRKRGPLRANAISGATRAKRKVLECYRRNRENSALQRCRFY